ncbi:hypothetical protein QJQ45_027984, partial [Haematococcus lacustris]
CPPRAYDVMAAAVGEAVLAAAAAAMVAAVAAAQLEAVAEGAGVRAEVVPMSGWAAVGRLEGPPVGGSSRRYERGAQRRAHELTKFNAGFNAVSGHIFAICPFEAHWCGCRTSHTKPTKWPCPTTSQPCVAPPCPALPCPACRCVAVQSSGSSRLQVCCSACAAAAGCSACVTVHEQQQQQVVVHEQQCKDSSSSGWAATAGCRCVAVQVAAGCRCASVHEQQQQAAVHLLQCMSSSNNRL